jgi:hypothetical protein
VNGPSSHDDAEPFPRPKSYEQYPRGFVTPDLVTVFAAAVGIPAGDLAALAGIDPPAGNEIPLGGQGPFGMIMEVDLGLSMSSGRIGCLSW